MKIGILTQPLHDNYGGLLQNYALQQILIKEGHDVKTIDWFFDFRSTREKIVFFIKTWLLSIFNPFFKKVHFLQKSETKELSLRAIEFKENIRRSKRITSRGCLIKLLEEEGFNAIIVGSDQCWRPKYNGPFLGAMFLDFACNNKVKRIAYAASFGTDNWEYSSQDTIKYSKLVKLFDFVSVRESSGIILCQDYLGVDAQLVLDPTMLLDIHYYIDLFKNYPGNRGRHLATYILDKSDTLEECLRGIENKTGLKRKELTPASYNYKDGKDLEKYKKMSVNDWLWYIYYAEMTIVDSFHGTVFSILFNKPFWVIGNERRGMSRFDSLLTLFDLEERKVNINDINATDWNSPINWVKVNNILATKRSDSIKLLFNALK